MARGKFIVVTGIDGTGKDFVAEHLHASDPYSHIIKTPTAEFSSSRQNIDTIALNMPAVHYYFYLASVIRASSLIKEMLNEGNVYCVRYLIDTVVYHRAMGLPIELEYKTPLYDIIMPDLTIFLSINNELTRQDRMKARGGKSVNDIFVDKENIRSSILSEYKRFSDHYVTVDNTKREINEVVKEIKEYILKLA